MLCGSLSMSLMNVTAKFLKQYTTISVIELCYFRSIIMTLGCLFHSYYSGFTVLDIPNLQVGKWVLLRSLFGFFAFTFQFVGIYLLPLSTAIVLYFTQPLSASVVNFIFNKEKLSVLEVMSIISAMFGVIVLTSPEMLWLPHSNNNQDNSKYTHYYIGVSCALLGSISSGFAYLTMRKIG